ncbi:MAG TPA: Na+/H+ antiporter NhaA [Puia sp.]|nr:Na+/H+ antiporter NhaA [Puia sp.]
MTTPALTKLFREFFDSEKAGGLLLVGCTIVSILLTNSGAGEAWLHFWHTIEHGVNDGLMAIFFLLVGLEIERELYLGELADFKKALLPIIAAIGGMLVPAGIHFLFNHGSPTQSGIGIPMATDIAFALGALSLLGKKVPVSVKIFLTALAIIDDLGAIIVIAIFYTKTLSLTWLALALGIFLLLLVFNRLKVNRLIFYIIPGILLWYCMLRSGIHATLSGVLLAFAIPFRKSPAVNPSEIIQHVLHKPVAFLILPIFALANTGILLSPGWANSLGSANSLGILTGLVLGKPLGILACCWLAIRTGLCRMPGDIRWSHLLGMGVLAGIGFTMSIFITNLAFDHAGTIQFSKIAILAASLIASVLGFSILALTAKLGTVFP